MPSHLLSTSAASACSRFSTHGWIELIRLTLPRSSAPTGYTFSGGSYLHRRFLFAHFSCRMRSGMFSVDGKELLHVFGAQGVRRRGWNMLHFSLGHTGDEFSGLGAITTTSSQP